MPDLPSGGFFWVQKKYFWQDNRRIGDYSEEYKYSCNKKNELTEKLDSVKKTRKEFENKLSELELSRVRLENIKDKEDRIKEIEANKESLSKDLEMLRKHMSSIEKTVLDYEKYLKNIWGKNKEIALSRKEENDLAVKKAEVNKEVQLFENLIKEKKKK